MSSTSAGFTGIRIGEAATLKIGDLDLMRGRLTIDETLTGVGGVVVVGPTKTGRIRTVSLPAFLRDLLAQHVAAYSDPKDPQAFVFTATEGGPLRPNNYRKRTFAAAVIESGVDRDLTPHDLRDTAATLAFSVGASVKGSPTCSATRTRRSRLRRYTGVLESMRVKTDDALDATFRSSAELDGTTARLAAVRP